MRASSDRGARPHRHRPGLEELGGRALDHGVAAVAAARRGASRGRRAPSGHRRRRSIPSDQPAAVRAQRPARLSGEVGLAQVGHRDRVRRFEPAQRPRAVAGRLPVHRAEHRDLRGRAIDAELPRRPARRGRPRAWRARARRRPTRPRAPAVRSGRGRRGRRRGRARRRPRRACRRACCADRPTRSSAPRRRRLPSTRRAADRRRPRFSSSHAYPYVVATRSALRQVRSASTSGCVSRSVSSLHARCREASTPTLREQRLHLARAAEIARGSRRRVAQHLGVAPGALRGRVGFATRTFAHQRADDAFRDTHGPWAGRRPRAPRTAARPPTRCARSSRRARRIGHRRQAGAAGAPRPAARAPPTPRAARRSSTIRRSPSRAADTRRAGPGRRAFRRRRPRLLNRSGGPAAGIASSARSCSCAHTRAGSACHPPNSSRCTAAMSQPVATRTPASTSGTAVAFDHVTQRGRIASSTRCTTRGGVVEREGERASRRCRQRRSRSRAATTSATRSPRPTPRSCSSATASIAAHLATSVRPAFVRSVRHSDLISKS